MKGNAKWTIQKLSKMKSPMDWKTKIDRKKNCMNLFAILQNLYRNALSEAAIVTASEDIEYKLMITHDALSDFEKDLARVYGLFQR
eukprot:g4769.t1